MSTNEESERHKFVEAPIPDMYHARTVCSADPVLRGQFDLWMRAIQWVVKLAPTMQIVRDVESQCGAFRYASIAYCDIDVSCSYSGRDHLVSVLRAFAAAGLRIHGKPVENGREVKWELASNGEVLVKLSVSRDGANCKQVKVGEKVVDVFAYQCEEPTSDDMEIAAVQNDMAVLSRQPELLPA
jgi:hypothetical protein